MSPNELLAQSLWTVAKAASWLAEKMEGTGADCPVCGRFAKYYSRAMNRPMVLALLEFYKRHQAHENGWVNYKDVVYGAGALCSGVGGDYAKLKHWGLLEHKEAAGPNDSGIWRVTPKGESFLRGRITVPQHVVLFADKFYRFDGPETFAGPCLGEGFDLEALMAPLKSVYEPVAQTELEFFK